MKTLAKAISGAYADLVSASFVEDKKLVQEALAGGFSKRLSKRIAG